MSEVIRVVKNKNYTVMSNFHLSDKNLSLKSKGLLSLMLSLPEDWQYTISGLEKFCKDGRVAIKNALEELEANGYMTRKQIHKEDGSFGNNEFIIYEVPQKENPQTVENSPLACFTLTDNALTQNASAQNVQQQNTNIQNTELTNSPPKAPQRGGRRVSKSIPDWYPELFERFWILYPRHEDRVSAVREWDRLKPEGGLLREMSTALKAQLESEEWSRGVGIPYACRWIKNKRWTDGLAASIENNEPEVWT